MYAADDVPPERRYERGNIRLGFHVETPRWGVYLGSVDDVGKDDVPPERRYEEGGLCCGL